MDTLPRLLVPAAVLVEGLAVTGLVLAVLTGPDPATLVPAVLGVVVATVATILALVHLARRRLLAVVSATGGAALGAHHVQHTHHAGSWPESSRDPTPHDHGGWTSTFSAPGWSGCDAGSPVDSGSSDSGSSCSTGSSGGSD